MRGSERLSAEWTGMNPLLLFASAENPQATKKCMRIWFVAVAYATASVLLNLTKDCKLIDANKAWQGRRDSNPRQPVLETGALPTELHP